MASVYSSFNEKLGGSDATTFVGNQGDLFWDPTSTTLRVSDGSTPGGVEVVGGGTITAEAQSGRSANIFIDNAAIAVIDTETINTIPVAECYLLCKTAITGDTLITEIASNAGENYYLYAYDGAYDENFPYGTELIVKLTREEAAICSLSPYFVTASGSIIEQAATRYPFLMADRRELDKLRAAVAAYYLSQAYDNATVLAKQTYWQAALDAAISGSIVSTWKVLNDMKAALSTGTNVSEAFLANAYPSAGSVYDPATGQYKPANLRYPGYAVPTAQVQELYLGYNFNVSDNLDNTNGSFVFRNPTNWTNFTSTYDTVSLIGPSGTYTWNLADALDYDAGYTSGKYIELTSSSQIADIAAVETLIDELYAETYSPSSQLWTLRFESSAAAANEDESVLDLVTQNLAAHIIKYPRYGVASPPTAGVYTKSFAF